MRGRWPGHRESVSNTPVEDCFPVPTDEELEFDQVMEQRASKVVWSDTASNGKTRFCSSCQERGDGGGHRNHVYYCGACLSTNQTARLFMGKSEFCAGEGKGVGQIILLLILVPNPEPVLANKRRLGVSNYSRSDAGWAYSLLL